MTRWIGKISACLVIVFFLVLALAPPPGTMAQEEGTTYTVKKGDTLWDITQKEFKDPFLWPKLWEVNPQLGNPHLIYPGNEINLEELRKALEEAAPEEEAVVEEVVVEEVAPEPVAEIPVAPEPASMRFGSINEVGFITPDHLKGIGVLFDSEGEKIMMSAGDEVYLEFSSDVSPTVGDVFTVTREVATVEHPETGKRVGYLNDVRGHLEISDVKKDYFVARVTKSYKPLEKGDKLIRHQERDGLIEYVDGPPELSGYIIELDKNALQGCEFRVVFLDVGSEDGVSVGNWMEVYRIPKAERLLGKERVADLAPWVLGDLLVISVEKDTSAAVVHKSAQSFQVGDFVRTKAR